MGPRERRAVIDPARPLAAHLEAMDRGGIRYLIRGSVASGIHGIFRATADVDLVADIRPSHVAALVRQLGAEF
jgi:hypothetical protein